MKGRHTLPKGVLGILGTAMACTPGTNKMENVERPNIMIITIDDLGWADIGVNGADLHETPHIDKLASQGMRFTQAYSASPVSSPTRASIQTGKYPARLHLTIWTESAKDQSTWAKLLSPAAASCLPLEETTIAELLKENGYQTIQVGKWHLGDAPYYPQVHGYDIVTGCCPWGAVASQFYPYRGKFASTNRYVEGFNQSTDGCYFKERQGEYLSDRMTEEAIKILKESKKTGKPFFMNLSYYSVHTPIEAKQDLIDYYKKKIKPEMRHQNAVYAAMVGILDQNIGSLMSTLDELNLADNTVVFFISDNGGFIGQDKGAVVTDNYPLRSGKGSLYEGGIRIPFIVRLPGTIKPASVCNTPVVTTDIFPTLLDLCNISWEKEKVDGKSILSLFKNPDATIDRDALFFHFPHYYKTTSPVSSVRKGNWKLVRYYEDNKLELYDLKADPQEKNNCATEYKQQADSLNQMLSDWLLETNAQLPEKNKIVQNLN